MEAKTSFIWAQSGIELHAIAAVDVDGAFVVFPDDAELDDAFGDGGDFEGGFVFWVVFEEGGVFERGCEFFVGLFEFGLWGDVGHGCGCGCGLGE